MRTGRVESLKTSWFWLVAAAAYASSANGFEFEPEATLERIFTSNVELAPDEVARPEQVTRLYPGFRLYHDAPRLDFNLDYRLEALQYSEVSARDEVYQQWDLNTTLVPVEEVFFIAADATRGQQNVNPQERLSNSNIYVNVNRTDIDSYNLRPYIDAEIGDAARLLLSYQVGEDDYGQELLQDVDFSQAQFSLSGPARFSRFNWGMDYTATALEYDVATIRAANANVTLGYGSPAAGLFVRVGQENDFFNPTVNALTEDRWDVGFSWSGRRASLSITRGERSFGETESLQFTYLLPRGTMGFSWTQAPATPALLAREQRGIDQTTIGLDRLGRTEIFVQTLAQFEFSIELSRSAFVIALYDDFRDRQLDAADPTAILQDEREQGLRVDWNWRAGVRTTLNFAGQWARRDFEQFVEPADVSILGAGLTYALGRRTDIGFNFVAQSQQGRTINALPYEERRGTLGLTRRFF